jgi:hypothetical protein
MAQAQTQILTPEEVRKAIDQDSSYPLHDLEDLASDATSFISRRTGYDKWGEEKNPVAKHCAKLYVRQSYYGKDGYNPDYDFSFGIQGDLDDLKDILRKRGVNVNAGQN